MTLRRKAFLTVGLTLAGLLIVIYLIASEILLASFTRLEAQEVHEDTERVPNALTFMLAGLDETTNDWAGWTDTYRFIQNGNRAYYSNFVDAGIAAIKLNLMVYIQPSGHILYGTGFDLKQGKKVPLPADVRAFLTSAGSLPLRHLGEKESKSGILLLSHSSFLVVCRPILTDAKRGPARGTLIFGRSLEAGQIDRLAKIIDRPLTVCRLDAPRMPPDCEAARAVLTPQQPIFTQPLSAQRVAGYYLAADILGHPRLIVRITDPRDVYEQGLETINYVMFVLLVIALIFCAITLLLLERGVLMRLSQLSLEVGSIRASSNIAARLPVQGQDELAYLVRSINEMLAALEQVQHQIQENEFLYRQMALNASDVLYMLEPASGQLHWYGQIDEMLGYQNGEFSHSVENWQEHLHPDDRQTVIEARAHAYASGRPFKQEYRIRCKDGSYLYWIDHGRAIQAQKGESPKFIGACTDITERKQAEAARVSLLQRLVTVQEEEQRRLSRELHDQIGQDLASLLLRLKVLPEQDHLAPEIAQRIRDLQESTLHLMQRTRRLALDLRPETLDRLGLPTALKAYTHEWAQRHKIAVDFHSQGLDDNRLDPDVEAALYRIVQEALTNVARHAKASRISVLLDLRADHVLAIVEDNGQALI
ncbi:MAG: PAS domain-containing protein [Abitibacteriaceae bacterium]|nr:PAS domain-containing protein [Abditibacteriaceae bacterium]MBV9865113.1 PAS domain-containing protein [Abditibacteriaceae bacterium]